MYYVFFDTETTGIPTDYKAPITNTDNWPRLVQLAWIVTSPKGEILDVRNFIVKPEGFEVPEAASNIHGISHERAMSEGVDLRTILNAFVKDIANCEKLIAHNMAFDKSIVGCEIYRLSKIQPLAIKTTERVKVCTMEAATEFCNIKLFGKVKWPKLAELYKKLFGVDFDGAHNALNDITATVRCYFELVNRGIIV